MKSDNNTALQHLEAEIICILRRNRNEQFLRGVLTRAINIEHILSKAVEADVTLLREQVAE